MTFQTANPDRFQDKFEAIQSLLDVISYEVAANPEGARALADRHGRADGADYWLPILIERIEDRPHVRTETKEQRHARGEDALAHIFRDSFAHVERHDPHFEYRVRRSLPTSASASISATPTRETEPVDFAYEPAPPARQHI